MNVEAIEKHFGGATKAAAALDVWPSAISNWRKRGRVPDLQQLKAEKLSRGKLKADPGIISS